MAPALEQWGWSYSTLKQWALDLSSFRPSQFIEVLSRRSCSQRNTLCLVICTNFYWWISPPSEQWSVCMHCFITWFVPTWDRNEMDRFGGRGEGLDWLGSSFLQKAFFSLQQLKGLGFIWPDLLEHLTPSFVSYSKVAFGENKWVCKQMHPCQVLLLWVGPLGLVCF